MAPEEAVIDASPLTKFRKLRLKDEGLLDVLLSKTVEIARKHNLIRSTSIIVDATHTRARFNQKSPQEFLREKAKERYKIEAKHSELKHRHGYDVANSSGLLGMQLQGAVTLFTVNIKRILTLLKENK